MKKLLPLIVILVLSSCSDNNEWSRDNLIKKCRNAINKQKDVTGMLTPDNIARICECDADKLMNQYSSKAEADKDQSGVEKVGTDCTIQVLTGK
jgi:hypothetical protein